MDAHVWLVETGHDSNISLKDLGFILSRVQVSVLNRIHGCEVPLNCPFTIIGLDWLKPCVKSTMPHKLYCNNKHPQISVASTTGLFLAHLHVESAGSFAVSTLWNVATAERNMGITDCVLTASIQV